MKTITMLIEVNDGHPWHEFIERQTFSKSLHDAGAEVTRVNLEPTAGSRCFSRPEYSLAGGGILRRVGELLGK